MSAVRCRAAINNLETAVDDQIRPDWLNIGCSTADQDIVAFEAANRISAGSAVQDVSFIGAVYREPLVNRHGRSVRISQDRVDFGEAPQRSISKFNARNTVIERPEVINDCDLISGVLNSDDQRIAYTFQDDLIRGDGIIKQDAVAVTGKTVILNSVLTKTSTKDVGIAVGFAAQVIIACTAD